MQEKVSKTIQAITGDFLPPPQKNPTVNVAKHLGKVSKKTKNKALMCNNVYCTLQGGLLPNIEDSHIYHPLINWTEKVGMS